MRLTSGHAALCLCLCFAVQLAGCAGPVSTTYDHVPLGRAFTIAPFRGDSFPIDRLAVCGFSSALAADVFIQGGYIAADLGEDPDAALDAAKSRGISFVAVLQVAQNPDTARLGVDALCFMQVLDLRTGRTIWRADDGPVGAWPSESRTLELTVREMVRALSHAYPPAQKPIAVAKEPSR